MWRITHIDCQDFISFRDARVDIPQNVCTLIYGVNLDNDRQKNNGTGKSSIIEAIAFGLTGEPLRDISDSKEIINDRADRANVRLELSNDYDNTRLTIDRTIDRKLPQKIECHKFDKDGIEIDVDKTSQPSVLDYNRYILDEIGLTKTDLYANFILSNSHYKSFFDANDKTKKAMINRFSGADVVDKAIEQIQADRKPVEDRLNKAKEAKISVDAKIEVVEQQIKDVDSKKEEFAHEKEVRINGLKEKIAVLRGEIRTNNEQIKRANKRLDDIDEAGAQIEDMQHESYDLSEAYHKVNSKLAEYKLAKTKDYLEMSKEADDRIRAISEKKAKKEQHVSLLGNDLRSAQKKVDAVKVKVDKFSAECKKADEDASKDLKDIQHDIEANERAIEVQWDKLKDLQDTSDRLDRVIREAHNQLHGTIVCPKCKHEFFLDEDISVEEVKKNLKSSEEKLKANKNLIDKANSQYDKLKAEKDSLNKEKEVVNKSISERFDQMFELRKELDNAKTLLNGITFEIGDTKRVIDTLENDIKTEQSKIDNMLRNMLGEALDIIDAAIDTGERYVNTIKDKNVAAKASIEAYEKSIETTRNSSQDDFIKSLDKSLVELKTEQSDAIIALNKVQKEFDKYMLQENYFVEFRSYLANKKVEAIAGVTNYFLELIGSDMRVEMLGFKRLKSGAIRDKITVNLLRNGVDCGSFGKFSAGERARVNLASILGLQRLTNNCAEDGKGLDIVILDEVLEASDTTGIDASCKALNRLGVTSLLVTQNPTAESEGHTLVVTKEHGYSTINEE